MVFKPDTTLLSNDRKALYCHFNTNFLVKFPTLLQIVGCKTNNNHSNMLI